MNVSGVSESFSQRIGHFAATRPASVAVRFVTDRGTPREVNWRWLDKASWSVAGRIREWITESDRPGPPLVAIGLPTSIEHLVCALAVHRAGGCIFPVSWRLPVPERDRLLELAQPSGVIADWADLELPVLGRAELQELCQGHSAEPFEAEAPGAWLAVASSGSTGAPKLILHRGALDLPPASVVGFLDAVGVSAADRFLPASPLYHSGGIIDALFGLFAGATIVLLERFSAPVALEAIERWGVNSMTIVPTMLKRMLEVPDVATRDYTGLRSMCSTAAPLPATIRRAWIDILGPERVLEIYAGSELTGLTSITGTEWLVRPGSVGRPVFSEIRIVGESGEELAPGEIGEIFMRSTTGGEGFEYRGAQPRRHRDGFYSIGDLGWVDTDGYLFVADRRTDLIVSGGANVYPNEVEEVLLSHPEIFDAAVIGLSDPEWGKRVHAVIQPVAGAAISDVDIRAFARERLVAYKVPKTVEFVEKLPRSELGKVQRNRLIEARERA